MLLLTSHAHAYRAVVCVQDLKVRTEKKVEKLEQECKEEDQAHWQRVAHIQKNNKVNHK